MASIYPAAAAAGNNAETRRLTLTEYEREGNEVTRREVEALLQAVVQNPALGERAVFFRNESYRMGLRNLIIPLALRSLLLLLALLSAAAGADRAGAAAEWAKSAQTAFCSVVYDSICLESVISYIVGCFLLWIASLKLDERRRLLFGGRFKEVEATALATIRAWLPLLLKSGAAAAMLVFFFWLSSSGATSSGSVCGSAFGNALRRLQQVGPAWEVLSSAALVAYWPIKVTALASQKTAAIAGLLSLAHFVATVFDMVSASAFGSKTDVIISAFSTILCAVLWQARVRHYGFWIVMFVVGANTLRLAPDLDHYLRSRQPLDLPAPVYEADALHDDNDAPAAAPAPAPAAQ